MNLKYYLRGLGIGIVVSTLLVGIATNNRTETLSDEEIRQRAAELGMVETSGVLSDVVPSAEASVTKEEEPTQAPEMVKAEDAKPTEVPQAKEEKAPTPRVSEKPEEEPTPTPQASEKPEEEPSPTPQASEKPEEEKAPTPEEVRPEVTPKAEMTGEPITITVKSGDGSYTVCKKLEEAGLVESATAYDAYLYERGYDKRIVAANHQIPAGADEEQIAKILTGKN